MSSTAHYMPDRQASYRASAPPPPAEYSAYDDSDPGPYTGGRGRGGRSGRPGRGRGGRGPYPPHGEGPAESDILNAHVVPHSRSPNAERWATHQPAGGMEEDVPPSHHNSRHQSAGRQRPPQRSAPHESFAQPPPDRSGRSERHASALRRNDCAHQSQAEARRSVVFSEPPAQQQAAGAPASLSQVVQLSRAQGKTEADAANAQKRADEADARAREAEKRVRDAEQRAKEEKERAVKTEELLLDIICKVAHTVVNKEIASNELVAVERAFYGLPDAPHWAEKRRTVTQALSAVAHQCKKDADRLAEAEAKIAQLSLYVEAVYATAAKAENDFKQAADMAVKAESTYRSQLERFDRYLSGA